MDKDKIGAWIAYHEGSRESIYFDSEGYPTIGVGFNLERQEAAELLNDLNLDYDKILSGEQTLSQNQIDYLFQHDLDIAIADAQKIFPNFDELPEDKQLVLVDMSFNLGYNKLSGFEEMIEAVKSEDWEKVAEEMVDSKWYEDVKDRAMHNVEVMQDGFSDGTNQYFSNYFENPSIGYEPTITESDFPSIVESPEPEPTSILDEIFTPRLPDIVIIDIDDPVDKPVDDPWNPSNNDPWLSDPIDAPGNPTWQNSDPYTPIEDSWNTQSNSSLSNDPITDPDPMWSSSNTTDSWSSDLITQDPINE